ncbi:hypothetical protein SISSUDRAFT_957112, partial [Sistotremastrum suecicum HHB10207 ss-3]
IRESIVKACDGDLSKWPSVTPYVFWSDRVTVRKATGKSPFEMAHGVQPTLPFDISEATFLGPAITRQLSHNQIVGIRARKLQKRPADLARMHEQILRRRKVSSEEYSRRFHSSLRTFDFKHGMIVLVRNIILDKGIGIKTEPRYIGPYIVVRKTVGGAYVLSELTGAVISSRFSANRLVPFYSRLSDDIL